MAFVAVVSFGTTVLLSPWIIKVLTVRNIVDTPIDRSSHREPVPRGGGLAMLLAISTGLILVLRTWADDPELVAVFSIAAAFALLGLVDDLQTLNVRPRLLAQAGLAGVFLSSVDTTVIPGLGQFGTVVAAIWILGFVNSFNFMDGINGISSAAGTILATSLAVASYRWGGGVELPCVALAGACLGFAPFNAGKARVFLGDVGSYFIGFELTALVILSAQASHTPWPGLTLVAPFVIDASLTLLARCWRGAPVWRAHREHLYQRLVLRGWSPARVASVLAALLIGVCWPGAAWSVVAGVLPALFVYGLLAIIWLWLRSRSVQPGANLPI